MSIVRINSIEVPEGREAAFEERFAQRAGQVESAPGFEEFLLLRPSDGGRRYFVLTRWESVEAFVGWLASRDFARAHGGEGGAPPGDTGGDTGSGTPAGPGDTGSGTPAGPGDTGSGTPAGPGGQAPVATDSAILAFDVIERVAASG